MVKGCVKETKLKSVSLLLAISFLLVFSVGFASAGPTDCSISPDDTWCGDCVVSGCWINGNSINLDYWISGTKTCQSGVCSDSTCTYESVCADGDIDDDAPTLPGYVSVSGCSASCDQDSDCTDYEYQSDGRLCQYNGECNEDSCVCGYADEEVCPVDGWYCDQDGNYEYRTYICGASGCEYTVNDEIVCDNGAFCDGEETCEEGVGCVAGTPPEIDDSVDCTTDSCDEGNDEVLHVPNDGYCDNGLYCDGTEYCDLQLDCQSVDPVDCDPFSLSPDETCSHDPDDKSFTIDIFAGFTSTCNEATDSCEQYVEWEGWTHKCDQQCGAECDETHACEDYCSEGNLLFTNGLCDLLGNCDCSHDPPFNCDGLDCSTGLFCVNDGDILSERGDDYSCVSGEGSDCGVTDDKHCNGPWLCNTHCADQLCAGDDYTCYNNVWIPGDQVPLTETECNNGIDDDCDGLIDCLDPDCGDLTPPFTEKTYGLPSWPPTINVEPGFHWITNYTFIEFFADDILGDGQDECVSGLDKTEYRYCLDDCYPPLMREQVKLTNGNGVCSCEGKSDWIEYTGEFVIPEDSEHCIEFRSVDLAGVWEPTHSQCIFVETDGPVPNKTVEWPRAEWDGVDSYFYPEETEHCWKDATGEEIECWRVTLDTPINMECLPSDTHPAPITEMCFKVDWDNEDITSQYCEGLGYMGEGNDGYCCRDFQKDGNISDFMFREESEHNLLYYCEDVLGNRQYDDEKFKVFGEMWSYGLDKKWNLISVPFDPINQTPEDVFREMGDDLDSVWSYNAETKSWYVYRPGDELLNNLDEIETGLGYWVMAEEASDFSIGGSLIAPGPISPPGQKIIDGWNLIGHYGLEDNDVYCSLYSLIDTQIGHPRWSALWGYDSEFMSFFPLSSMEYPMETGMGYWLEMDVDDYYVPSTECFTPPPR